MSASDVNDGVYYNDDIYSHGLKQYGFRCYACPIVGGIPNENWEDITHTDYYTYLPDEPIPAIIWNTVLLAANNLFVCVKVGGFIHWYDAPQVAPDIANYPGYMMLTVTSRVVWDGGVVVRPQSLAPGIVDVFMDEKCLIQGLDYYIQWPNIVVVKKPSTTVNVTDIKVRSYGHCDKVTGKPLEPRELSFVKGGILSVNNHFDVRNDRCVRINVGGGLKRRDQVSFAEVDHLRHSTDGRPYSISDYLLSVEGFTTRTTNDYRDASVDVDNRVSDYLTTRLPTIHPNYPIVEIERWLVYSPFCSAVIHAVKHGLLGALDGTYSDVDVDNFVTPWKFLLDYDPCIRGFEGNYVIVLAHQHDEVIAVTSAQYSFIERVIETYLHGIPDLTPSVSITG
jgi:hypothetical protein